MSTRPFVSCAGLECVTFVRLSDGSYAGHWAGHFRATARTAATLPALLSALDAAREVRVDRHASAGHVGHSRPDTMPTCDVCRGIVARDAAREA